MTGIRANIEQGPRGGLHKLLRAFRDDENGATSIEYGLIVALIFLAVVSAIRAYSNSTSDMYSEINDALTGG